MIVGSVWFLYHWLPTGYDHGREPVNNRGLKLVFFFFFWALNYESYSMTHRLWQSLIGNFEPLFQPVQLFHRRYTFWHKSQVRNKSFFEATLVSECQRTFMKSLRKSLFLRTLRKLSKNSKSKMYRRFVRKRFTFYVNIIKRINDVYVPLCFMGTWRKSPLMRGQRGYWNKSTRKIRTSNFEALSSNFPRKKTAVHDVSPEENAWKKVVKTEVKEVYAPFPCIEFLHSTLTLTFQFLNEVEKSILSWCYSWEPKFKAWLKGKLLSEVSLNVTHSITISDRALFW